LSLLLREKKKYYEFLKSNPLYFLGAFFCLFKLFGPIFCAVFVLFLFCFTQKMHKKVQKVKTSKYMVLLVACHYLNRGLVERSSMESPRYIREAPTAMVITGV
jgi:predicted membrane protein